MNSSSFPWFVYDYENGIEFYATEAEAKAAAQKILEFWRGEAISDGEWSDEVEHLVWGRVHQFIVEVPIENGDEERPCCDFVLADMGMED